jgi:integrase
VQIANQNHVHAANAALTAANAAAQITFAELASAYIETMCHGWRSRSHYEAVCYLLETSLATKDIREITPDDVESAVISASQRDRRLRTIRGVFDFAISRGIRMDNPADHKIMRYRLPNGRKSTAHYRAMPYEELPVFVSLLRTKQLPGVLSPYVIEFLILTACRANEVAAMRLEEINWQQRTWTIPAYRTKTQHSHRVPLSARATELLKQQCRLPIPGAVWLSRAGQPIGAKALYLYLTRYMHVPYTIHGFRSSFRNWCAEQTNYDFNLCEMCLAHTVANATVRAYLRSDMLEKRREIMNQWAAFCGSCC